MSRRALPRLVAPATAPDWAMGGLIFLLAALVYANALANGWALDDTGIISQNPLVHSPAGIWRAFARPYWPNGAGQYRPLVVATFALDWVMSGGAAWWLHLVNVLWHAAATVLVWRVARTMLAAPAAAAAALLFAVHPVHVEAVANTVGRSEAMAAVFVLAAWLLHRRGSALAVLCFAVGLLAKESAIVLPGLVALHDVLLTPDWRAALRRRARLYVGYGLAAVAYGVLLFLVFRGQSMVWVAPFWIGLGVGSRLLTVLSIVPVWTRLMVWPVDLAVDYAPQTVVAAHSVTGGVALGATIVLALGIVVVHSWRRAPVVAFGILWFAVALSPVSNVLFPTGLVVGERTLYLPSLGFVLLAALALEWLAARRVRWAPAAFAAVLLALVARTWVRTPTWRDSKTMLLTWLADHPESYRAHEFAGVVHEWRGDHRSAAAEFAKATFLFQRDAGTYFKAAGARTFLGDYPAAIALLDSAIAIVDDYGPAYLGRADLNFRLGRYPAALADARRAERLMPDSVRAAYVQAAALERLGRFAPAARVYEATLATHPGACALRFGYVQYLLARGDTSAAIGQLRRAAARGRADAARAADLDTLWQSARECAKNWSPEIGDRS